MDHADRTPKSSTAGTTGRETRKGRYVNKENYMVLVSEGTAQFREVLKN